jgi:excisionase family DNA binding protein
MAELTLADKIAQEVVARILPHIDQLRNGNSAGNLHAHNGNRATPKRLLTVKEAAGYLGRPSESSIYHLVYRRELPCVRHGRNLRFDVKELDKWIEGDKV